MRSALNHIRLTHPFWNRTNGADHFLVYSYDRGAPTMQRQYADCANQAGRARLACARPARVYARV